MIMVSCLLFRDGTAVELVGLCASTVKWLASMSGKKLYPYEGVKKNEAGEESRNLCMVLLCFFGSFNATFVYNIKRV